VDFAGEVIALLKRRGFDHREARRYFAIFYQLRRAFYFIVRGLVGVSPCMAELRRHLWNNIFTRDVGLYERHLWNCMEDFSTLLLGETGTGKGTAAAAIGRSGFIPFDEKRGCFAESFARNFISLNLAQFPETLIESELFGHRKGAFTGAVESHEGLLARCSPHGAIFLDEIGDVGIPIQIKLLHVLQERTFSPVGSHEQVRFRGRVIAATNKPLDTLRSEGLFREDFFYRLCSDMIEVPPLRQRLREDPDELSRLVSHILRLTVGDKGEELNDAVVATIRGEVGEDYRWPGNVRELEQAVRRVLLTGEYQPEASDAKAAGRPAWLIEAEAGKLDADAVLAGYCRQLHTELGSYEAVAGRTRLDRRTVRKYIHLPHSCDTATLG
jgi:DNA-binding NtrC family response regulator